jgi:hypothetical protein
MKKIVLFLIFFNYIFAYSNYKIYEDYINQILNYSLKLSNDIYNPFVPKKIVKKDKSKKQIKSKITVVQVKPKVKVLAILNDEVLLNYKDVNKNEKKWLKIGESLENYKLISIKKNTVLFKYKNTIKVLPIDIKTNKFKLKVSK